MARYRFLTLDCYGTLMDWRAGIAEHLGGSCAGTGWTCPPRRCWRPTWRRSTGWRRGLTADTGRSWRRRRGRWPPFPDTVEGLKALGAMGFRRVILSNVDRDLLAETIRCHRLEVDGAVTAEDTRTYKPHPQHWLTFCTRYGARREEVLHIAQSLLHDVQPALGLKRDCVWRNRYGEPLPEDLWPTHVVEDMDALVGWLLAQ